MRHQMVFSDWLKIGIANGFVGPVVCATHDGTPTTAAEDQLWEQGDDICINIMRVYSESFEKEQVEENHSPSVWRNPFRDTYTN